MGNDNLHQDCPSCFGTGFQPFEKDGYSFVRVCPMAPERKEEKLGLRLVVDNQRVGGWSKVG